MKAPNALSVCERASGRSGCALPRRTAASFNTLIQITAAPTNGSAFFRVATAQQP